MTQLSPILSPSEVHARDRIWIWIALAFSAGAVNAIALAACQRFVTHVTGTITLVGVDHADAWLVVEYASVVVCFVLGAMTSVVLIDGRRLRYRQPWPLAPLGIVTAVLFFTAIAGSFGVFGPFGRTVETPGDFVLLSILGFAMGLQNAAVATTTGMIVRTTHMTGPVTDFAVALATAFSGGERAIVEAARQSARIRGAKILAFLMGALSGALAAGALQYRAFFLPAGVTLLASVLLHRTLAEAREHRRRPSPPDPAARPAPQRSTESADASAE